MFVFDTDHLGILNSGHGADYEAICRHLDECDELEKISSRSCRFRNKSWDGILTSREQRAKKVLRLAI